MHDLATPMWPIPHPLRLVASMVQLSATSSAPPNILFGEEPASVLRNNLPSWRRVIRFSGPYSSLISARIWKVLVRSRCILRLRIEVGPGCK
ncbi:hypothetical protein BKA61DRAFT_162688 [Leptodontidium sp. MPI-SDFR-AT-0119]|nr:hypothetical protein BKA61DRAFT_162688 [Leptodontidium sp. MPI-SDFR-AT-0119]